MIHETRIADLNEAPVAEGRYVLYWMQASQRSRWNYALEHAIERANERKLPLTCVFGLTDGYPEANLRHYAFLLQGLGAAAEGLADRGVTFVVLRDRPDAAALRLADAAALIVCDAGYLRHQRRWRDRVADEAPCPVVEVEADVVVPVETVMQKEAYSAAVLRRRIAPLLEDYLVELEPRKLKRSPAELDVEGEDLDDLDGLLDRLEVDRSVTPSERFRGGQDSAGALLDAFVRERLKDYHQCRNAPGEDCVSHMSPYLHFGQISPVEIALAVRSWPHRPTEARDAYLEELIVRRELSMNFVHFNPEYDKLACLPDWARKTLEAHAGDDREATYTESQLDAAQTHDPYWNAAQREMVATGKMHNYMRMYWGKKILQWIRDPARAFQIALRLNNRYELDGRDPNSYAGIAWCFGKHDRPWVEREVFGKVRYMSDSGLERKFDMSAYLDRVGRG